MVSARTLQVRARRDALRIALGGRCTKCPNVVGLEFDCIKPRGDAHHKAGSLKRIQFYEAEAAAGNLQLLCKTCHRQKTTDDRRGIKRTWCYEI